MIVPWEENDTPEGATMTRNDRDSKPPWCGECELRTRLVFSDDSARRCRICHPLVVAAKEAGSSYWCGRCDHDTRFKVDMATGTSAPCKACYGVYQSNETLSPTW